MPAVNASGVFNTNGLTCPETEVECARCPAPLNTGPFHAPVNLTGVRVIGCRYRADVCDALREETKACKRHARSLCAERDARAQAKAKCRRVLNRAWKTKCKEQRTTLVTRTDALEKRFVDLQDRMKKARAKRAVRRAFFRPSSAHCPKFRANSRSATASRRSRICRGASAACSASSMR